MTTFSESDARKRSNIGERRALGKFMQVGTFPEDDSGIVQLGMENDMGNCPYAFGGKCEVAKMTSYDSRCLSGDFSFGSCSIYLEKANDSE